MSKVGRDGGSLSSDQQDVLDKLIYDELTDTLVADASFQTKPSTVYLGSAFGMSNGVQAVGFRLADGADALGIVNRFDKSGGTYSNPKFFALGQSSMLNVQLSASTIMSAPIEVNYTTTGDNLTYMFEIIPASAGRLRAQYWLGDSESDAPVVDFHYDVTEEQAALGAPIQVIPNFYVLPSGSPLFVRFSGVDLKGNGVTPYFRSQILPYKEITINGHVERITGNPGEPIYIGCDYAADVTNGLVARSVPLVFKDRFRVYDYKKAFTTTKKCVLDFSAHGQGKFEMVHAGDDCTFYHVTGDGWYVIDNLSGAHSKVTARTTTRLTANRVMIVNALGERTASVVTTTELSAIDGGTKDSNVTMVDADRFVINDAGTMRQLKASNVFNYIKSKLVGAISSALTDDLTANRVIVSDAEGKLAATSTMTPAELESLKPYKYIGGGSYSNKTFTVCSNLRGWTVRFVCTTTAISLRIKNTSSSNVTANGIVAIGGNNSNDGWGWYEDISGSSEYEITSISKGQITDGSRTASKAGVALFSVKNSASSRHIAIHYAIHNTDGDEYAVYCKAE